ncbi:uncharacterized protein LOC129005583 isoform X1 [Macrosteles quadrilineatus]|uniref:uncharacterized protein LOC129005583 isoform X1 n=1 Tax=Macrosteles quadrilineatus TaxID=74068 RepID=UPI0023E0CBF8|nr:uncharacterized protein LOC129005583 isoform X1 [Macrosteles quadrilineatus]XP_054290484.1 uncharacterized protein LOC129005583 isoform X1 [Macrosteles quadrilineatus]XP_054290485.1 uncharacterized protein LOC129005583 isoform X1 [Macrosteles quadrilineatus]XP_054290486.1 uncharacterized protein LOC129005583 isoform X1 [Macrosteles quadrilineatus]
MDKSNCSTFSVPGAMTDMTILSTPLPQAASTATERSYSGGLSSTQKHELLETSEKHMKTDKDLASIGEDRMSSADSSLGIIASDLLRDAQREPLVDTNQDLSISLAETLNPNIDAQREPLVDTNQDLSISLAETLNPNTSLLDENINSGLVSLGTNINHIVTEVKTIQEKLDQINMSVSLQDDEHHLIPLKDLNQLKE